MARKVKSPEPVDTIAEIESMGERAIEWVGQNGKAVLSVAVICLLFAGTYGYFDSVSTIGKVGEYISLKVLRVEGRREGCFEQCQV